MKKLLFLFLGASLFFIQCDTKTVDPKYSKIRIDTDNDFLVFGSIASKCTGDCKELYLLTSEALYPDSNDSILVELNSILFDNNPLAFDVFLEALYLLQDVPDLIVDSKINEHDLIDYIADVDIHIYGQRNGIQFALQYDAIENTAPLELRTYVNNVKNIIERINN